MNRVSPILAEIKGQTAEARSKADALGLINLAASQRIVPVPAEIDTARIGTAFDIRIRIALGGFDVQTSSSAAGMNQLPLLASKIENGRHRAQVLFEAFDIAGLLLQDPSSDDDLNIASIVLAHGEQIYRAGRAALTGSVGTACDQARDGQQFVENISSRDLHDMQTLLSANSAQINLWQEQIDEGTRFETNLDFVGSSLVGGADADWLIGDTLIDCKVYGNITVSRLRDFLRQLLGYVMLDLNDALKIRHVAIWLPRQRRMQTWSLNYLLGGEPEKILPELRDGFVKATSGEQLGTYQPLSERRKHQQLADNFRTPVRMLKSLANSNDKDIRFRVARNVATPERTLRVLARDRYAGVREGIAINPSTPSDVVETLHNDSSIVVRRRAAENPGSNRPRGQALTRGNGMPAASTGESSETKLSSEIVSHDSEAATRHLVQINDQRDDWVLDSRWMRLFLGAILRKSNGANDSYLFPRASQNWSDQLLELPHHLLEGLPREILADLFRQDRPAYVRQTVASTLPLEDCAVRRALLRDVDPEIRWYSLRRSVHYVDETMADFLAELGTSQTARIRFRTDDAQQTNPWQRLSTSDVDDQILPVIAAHPSTPSATLGTLLESKAPEVLLALAQNAGLQPDDREALVTKMKAVRSSESRHKYAQSSNTPPEVLTQLAGSRLVDIRFEVAANRSTPVDILTKLSTDTESAVRLGVLRNSKTPSELATAVAESLLASSADRELQEALAVLKQRDDIVLPVGLIEAALDRLSKSRVRDPDLRRSVTSDDRTGAKTLKRLASSKDEQIRQGVAGHEHTPLLLLSRLAHDPSWMVRRAVADNPNTSQQTLLILSQDENWQVRRSIASNSTLDNETLRRLLSDENQHVRFALLKNPALASEDAHILEAERQRNAQPRRWTQEQLHEMAASKRTETRMRVANSPDATPDILKFLSGQRRNKQVRRIVAAHPRTSAETLWNLADDEDLEVRQAIALNPSSPAGLLAHLAGKSIDFALLVALNPDVPDKVLDALTTDGEALVQFVSTVVRADRALGSKDEKPSLER